MWLTSSSIGRKFVMALTGVCLVLFVTFHVVMNAVCIFWPAAYNQVCMFLGANWYALIASVGLAALFIIHIIYAVWLTLQNRKARGADRYEVTSRPPQVEWSSKNMLVLGFVILAFLCLHMYQFWAKMQLQELMHCSATVDGVEVAPVFGTLFIQAAFSQIWVAVAYIVAFVALWFHLNHGIWSMFHSVGWDNNIWLCRLKTIACWWTSIVVGLFIIEAVVFTVQAGNNYYYNDAALQEQYAEHLAKEAQDAADQVNTVYGELSQKMQKGEIDQAAAQDQLNVAMRKFVNEMAPIVASADKLCPSVANQDLQQIRGMYESIKMQLPAEEPAQEAAPAAAEETVEVETSNN